MFWLSKKENTGARDQNLSGKYTPPKLEVLQRRWADYLKQKTTACSVKRKRWVLILFCLVFGGCSLVVTIRNLLTTNTVLNITPIKVVPLVQPAQEEKLYPTVHITEEEFERIRSFHTYMDSLNGSLSGKSLYDSIVQARPGLMDSIAQMEIIYNQQTKK